MCAFKNLGFFTLVALFFICARPGNAAAVTTAQTLYAVQTPANSFPAALPSSAQFFEPMLSESFSVIDTGDNGATRYLVDGVKTAEVVYEATTTFTQAAPTLASTVPLVFTVEQDASHIDAHILPTSIDSHLNVPDLQEDCTMDTSQNQGECNLVISFVETVTIPATGTSKLQVSTLTQTTTTSWTGVLTPVATVTRVISGGQRLEFGESLRGIIALLVLGSTML